MKKVNFSFIIGFCFGFLLIRLAVFHYRSDEASFYKVFELRKEVINVYESGWLSVSDDKIELPQKYKKTSLDGIVDIKDNGKILCFMQRSNLAGANYAIYDYKDNIVHVYHTMRDVVKIKRMEENWFLVSVKGI